MGKLVLIRTDGYTEEHVSAKADHKLIKQLIGPHCTTIERVRCRYNGHARDCWLDEEGLLRSHRVFNPYVRKLVEAYYKRPCQEFAGNGVIWVPRT